MVSDSPAAIMGALALIDDDMAELLPGYAAAAGWIAEFELWERREFLAIKSELRDAKLLTREALGLSSPNVTETAIKDAVQKELFDRYPDQYDELARMKNIKGKGDVLFKGQDARRSIGQSLLKRHTEVDHSHYGQGAGQ